MFFNLIKALSANAALLSAAASDSDAAAAEAVELGFKFEPDNFLQALPTIGTFTLAIFAVMAVIIIATALINKLGSIKPKSKTDDAQ